jgi:hypothetical protein
VDIFASQVYEKPTIGLCNAYNVHTGNKEMIFNLSDDYQLLYLQLSNYTTTASFMLDIKEVITTPEISADNSDDQKSALSSATLTTASKVCTNCGQAIPVGTFQLHVAFCERNNVKCMKCNNVFKKDTFESRHWHCDECTDVFGDISIRDKHMKLEHTTLMPCKCGIQLYLKDYISHLNLECPKRLIICRYCHVLQESGPNSTHSRDLLLTGPPISQHESECGSRTIKCQKCKRNVTIKDVALHMKMHNYEKQYRPLPMILCRNRLCSEPVDRKNEVQLCTHCFGPFWNPQVDPQNQKLIQRMVTRYFTQLSTGCGGVDYCLNMYCKSSSMFIQLADSSPNGMALKSLELTGLSGLTAPIPAGQERQFWLCVERRVSEVRQIAETIIQPMGFELEWCIEALKKGRRSYVDLDDDDESTDDTKSHEKYKNYITNFAISWLQDNY